METQECCIVNPVYNQRYGICSQCGNRHWYNIKPFKVDAYNIKYKMYKDYQRVKHAKDLLQPVDKHGKHNETFYKAYGKLKTNKTI